jgi:hypothetical protein
MGMYTEIYVNVDLKQETPDEVLNVLKAMCGKLEEGDADDALKAFRIVGTASFLIAATTLRERTVNF